MTEQHATPGANDQRPAAGAPAPDGGVPPGGDSARRPVSARRPAPQRPQAPAPQWDPASAMTWESWDPEPVPMGEKALAPWADGPAPQWAPASPAAGWGPTDQNAAAPAQRGPADPGRRADAAQRWRPPSLALRIGVPAAVLVGLAAVLGFAWPGLLHAKAFDAATLETGVTTVLRDSYRIDATNVTCPVHQPVRAGATFACSVRVDGQARTVTVAVRSGAGQVEVGRPR